MKLDIRNLSFKSLFILLFFLLIAIVGLFKLNSSKTKVSAAWFNDSWMYRKAVSITNTSGSNLTDFQVSLSIGTSALINAGKMKSDCSDIRITDNTGKLLNFWIEENNPGCNQPTDTKIWLKAPSLPTSGATVFVYYGNPSATSTQSGDQTFEFFDDFNDGNISDWTSDGNWQVDTSDYTLKSLATTSVYIGKAFSHSDCIIESEVKTLASSGDPNAWIGFRKTTALGIYDSANLFAGLSGWSSEYSFHNGSTHYTTGSGSSIIPNQWYHMRIVTHGGNVELYNLGVNSTTPQISGTTSLLSGNYIGFRTNVVAGKFDNIRVRKYASTDPTSTLQTEEVSTGPIAYWKFDEGVGTTAYDSTSSRNNGIFGTGNSSPTWTTEDQCISGKCLYFNGSTSYVDFGNPTSINFQDQPLTINTWIKPQGLTAGTIFGKDLDSTDWDGYYMQWIGDGTVSFNLLKTYGSVTGTVTTISTLPLNQWSNITATYTNTKMYIYVNGKLNNSIDYNGGYDRVAGYNAIMGKHFSASVNFFKGYIDETKIYPYARTAAQIKSDYAAGKAHASSNKGTSANLGSNKNNSEAFSEGLVGYWKMDENSGTTTTDSSGNSNTATFGTGNSAPTWSNGKYGIGLSFDGVSDFIGIGNTINLGTIHTISVWAKKSGSTENIILGYNGNNYAFDFYNGNRIYYAAGGSGTYWDYTWDSNWHFYNIVRNGTTLTLFIDGISKGDKSITNNSLSIDRIGDARGWSWNGSLDEVRIYNRALSPSEVSQLYNWAPGPIGYWDFENGSGNTVNDKSGYSNNGTWTGGSSHWAQGKYGAGGNFTGDSNYINIPSLTWAPTMFTVEFWLNPSSNSDYNQQFLASSGWGGFVFHTTSTGGVYVGTDVVNRFTIDNLPANTVKLNQWQHFTFTFDNGTGKFYKNGILLASKTGMLNPTAWNGFNFGTPSNNINGKTDEVKIYNYARSAKQIVEDMNAGHPAGGSPVGSQLGYWKFDEGYGNIVNNSGNIGSTLNGSISGATWTNNGKYNKALLFDGTDDYVIANNQTSLNPTSITISMWLNLNIDPNCDGNNNWRSLLHKGSTSATATGYDIILEEGRSIAWDTGNGATDRWWPNNISIPISSWTQLVLIYDETGKKLAYINGKLADTKTVSAAPLASNTSDLYINNPSSACPAGAGNFPGIIDEVKIYNYALTEDEIKIDYNRNSALQMGSLSSGTGNTAPSTASSQEYCIPGDTAVCTSPVTEWNFEENIGTTANDTSGNNTTGTINGATWTTGKNSSGAALSFNGTTNYVSNTRKTLYTGGLTFEAWVKTTSADSGVVYDGNAAQNIIGDSTSGVDVGFGIHGGKVRYQHYSGAWYNVLGSTSVNDGKWHHIAVTHKTNGVIVLYVDGKQDTTGNITYTYPAYDVIGRGYAGDYFTGQLDNIRIYNYDRTPAQIAYDYNRGAPIGHWKFDECQGSTAFDVSGLGNTGTIIIGASGTQNSLGTCQVGTSAAWTNGASGKYNSSLNFDGTDDYVEIASNFGISQNYTISFWAKHNVASKMPLASRVDTSFYWYGDNSWRYVHGGVGGEFYYPKSVSIPYGTWGYFTVTYDGANVRIYRNGKLEGSQSSTGTANFSNGFFLGQWAADTSYRFNGQIDDVRIYNYALTSTQIKTLYNNGSVNFSGN